MESSETHVFEPLKVHLLGNRFAAEADVKPAVTSWLQTLKNISSTPSKQVLLAQWDKSRKVIRDSWRSGVYHLIHRSCILRSQNKSLDISVCYVILSFLLCCFTSREVAGSIPDSVIEILHRQNPSGCTKIDSASNINWGVKAASV